VKRLAFAGVVVVWIAFGSANALTATKDSTGSAQSRPPVELKAFQRPARPGDAVPRAALPSFTHRYGKVVASRRIATARALRRSAALYLVRFKRPYTCLIQVVHGAGGGTCSPSGKFVSDLRLVNAVIGAGFLNGVASNGIARVVRIDTHGSFHRLRMTRDGGFLYACGSGTGCVKLVGAVNGYNRRGNLVFHERF